MSLEDEVRALVQTNQALQQTASQRVQSLEQLENTVSAAASEAAVSSVQPYAEQAQAAAQLATAQGNKFTTIALGIAGTTNGQDFTVYPGGSDNLTYTSVFRNNAGVALLLWRVADQRQVAGLPITTGDLLPTLATRVQAFRGATVISVGGKLLGVTVPAGQDGRLSYALADVPAVALRGKRVRLTQYYTATAGFVGGPLIGAAKAGYRTASASLELPVIDYTITQTGTQVVQEAVISVPMDAVDIDLRLQVASTAPTASSDISFQVQGTSYVVLSDTSPVNTNNDVMLDLRLKPVNAAIADLHTYADQGMLTSGEMWGTSTGLAGSGQGFNGGVITRNAASVPNGISIAASGGNGGSSYITNWMSATGLAGAQIDITTTYSATAGFSTDTLPTTLALQIRRVTGNVNVVVGSGATRTITQSGTTLISVIRYTVDAADMDIGVCYQVAGGYPTRAYDRSLTVQSMTYLTVPVAGRTRNDAMLEAFVKAAIAEAASDVVDGYAKVVTVKPSGGDYSHPKLALDAISDASASKKYKIAIYPGTYTGYAEWHTKDYVDLVGIGRRDEIIISYANATDASAATISNTSLFWLDTRTLLRNLTLEITNGRYVIHPETGGLKPGIITTIENCVVQHHGNTTAVNNTWNFKSQYAIGAGNSPGQKIVLRGSTLIGPGGGFSYHLPNNGVAYVDPTITDAEGCKFVSTSTDPSWKAAFSIKPICKGAGDECRLVGNVFIGDVHYSSTEWLDTADTTTNRAQIYVWGYGNTGFNWVNLCTGAAADYMPSMT